MVEVLTNSKVSVTYCNLYSFIVIRFLGFCSHYHENYKQKSQHKGRQCVKWMRDKKMITVRSTKQFRRINSCKALLWMQLYNICSFNPTRFIYSIPTRAMSFIFYRQWHNSRFTSTQINHYLYRLTQINCMEDLDLLQAEELKENKSNLFVESQIHCFGCNCES